MNPYLKYLKLSKNVDMSSALSLGITLYIVVWEQACRKLHYGAIFHANQVLCILSESGAFQIYPQLSLATKSEFKEREKLCRPFIYLVLRSGRKQYTA